MQTVVILLCIWLMAACQATSADVAPSQSDRAFFRMKTSEQMAKFTKLGLEAQYELLIVGNQIVEPPAMYLIPEFAKQGQAAIPLLTSKLTQAKEEGTVRDIVAILVEMHRLKLYSEAENPALRALTDKRVTSMTGQWKSTTERMLVEMRRGNGSGNVH